MTLKPSNHVAIQGWMRTEANLKGNALILYAIIHGFSQSKDQKYHGNLQYLADWCGISKQSVITSLKALVDQGLIIKEEVITNGVKLCEYSVNDKLEWYSKNLNGSQETGTKNYIPSFNTYGTNNTNNTNSNNSTKRNNNKQFIPPTLEDIKQYCIDNNLHVDANQFYKYFTEGEWIDSKGKPVRNWKQKLLTWEKYNTAPSRPNQPQQREEIPDEELEPWRIKARGIIV